VTTRAENIGLRFDYENEIQFHFQLELYRAGRRAVNKLKIEGCQNGNSWNSWVSAFPCEP
jgi:hypothetical protein